MWALLLLLVSPTLGFSADRHHGTVDTYQQTGNVLWSNCAFGKSTWLSLSEMNISPKPLMAPGDMTLSLAGSISSCDINAIPVNVTVNWISNFGSKTIPCFDNKGSCYYANLCDFLNSVTEDHRCPPELGFTDDCSKGKFKLPAFKVKLPKFYGIFGRMLDMMSQYYVWRIEMRDQGTELLRGCVEATLLMGKQSSSLPLKRMLPH